MGHVDVVFVTGDAYVDHPSFAMGLLGRLLESEGYRVAILSQPDWHSCEPWRAFGRPRLCFAVSAGNMDSMLNHYTANRKVRNDDAYSPGGQIGRRPDPGDVRLLPASPGGVQGSADHRRRRRGEPAATGPLRLLERQSPAVDPARRQGRPGRLWHGGEAAGGNRPPSGGRAKRPRVCDIPAVVYRLGASETAPTENTIALPSFEEVSADKQAFVEMMLQSAHLETNPYNARWPLQFHGREADRGQPAFVAPF